MGPLTLPQNGDTAGAEALFYLALLAVLYIVFVFLRYSPRVTNAPAAQPRTARQRALAAAASVEHHGHDLVFRCSCCKQRRLERGLEWPAFVERLTDPSPVCKGCADERIVLLEQELSA